MSTRTKKLLATTFLLGLPLAAWAASSLSGDSCGPGDDCCIAACCPAPCCPEECSNPG